MLMTLAWHKRVMFLLQHPQKESVWLQSSVTKWWKWRTPVVKGEAWKCATSEAESTAASADSFCSQTHVVAGNPLGCFSPLNPLCSCWCLRGVSGIHSLSLGERFIPFTASFVFFSEQTEPTRWFLFYTNPLRLEHDMRAWCYLLWSTAPTCWFSGPARVWPPATTLAEVEVETKTFQVLFPPINVMFFLAVSRNEASFTWRHCCCSPSPFRAFINTASDLSFRFFAVPKKHLAPVSCYSNVPFTVKSFINIWQIWFNLIQMLSETAHDLHLFLLTVCWWTEQLHDSLPFFSPGPQSVCCHLTPNLI